LLEGKRDTFDDSVAIFIFFTHQAFSFFVILGQEIHTIENVWVWIKRFFYGKS
jgi:hypothetical protein